MALPKNSPYKIFFKRVLLKLMEKGPLVRMYTDVLRESAIRCAASLQRKASKPISLEKIFTLFFFLMFACFVSLILLIIENIQAHSQMKKQLDNT
jgi:hypothetical protein